MVKIASNFIPGLILCVAGNPGTLDCQTIWTSLCVGHNMPSLIGIIELTNLSNIVKTSPHGPETHVSHANKSFMIHKCLRKTPNQHSAQRELNLPLVVGGHLESPTTMTNLT